MKSPLSLVKIIYQHGISRLEYPAQGFISNGLTFQLPCYKMTPETYGLKSRYGRQNSRHNCRTICGHCYLYPVYHK